MCVCPNCGYCPCCGRPRQTYPYYSPQYPYIWNSGTTTLGNAIGGWLGETYGSGGLSNVQGTAQQQGIGQQQCSLNEYR